MTLRLGRGPRLCLPVTTPSIFGLAVARRGLVATWAASAVLGALIVMGCGQDARAQTTKGTIPPPATSRAAPAAVPPVSSDPATTSATYGDWVLRCQRVGEEDKAQRLCEVVQLIQMQNQRDPVAEIALGRLPHDQALHLTTVLPPSVSFPSAVQFTASDKTSDGVQLQWRRCLSGGCFADVLPSDDIVRMWRGATSPGKLTFKDATGRDVSLPISFRGLAQALDALPKS